MTQELRLLLWTIVLGLVQLVAAAVAKRLQEPRGWAAGPRDGDIPHYSGMAARLARAQANLMETLPFFAAAILVCHAVGREGGQSAWGAQLYFWGRIVYVPLYGLGIPYLRTVVWLAATVGLCLVLAACLG
jgi:uncharacterized MAPEG superfamily protein